ncbi:aldo/keto reductase [uncultured Methanobrevibacter sp.]|uniref:aldo/keto reductase n=1 Tax=uncultured Methanobrevibacter sp. TaxID=253161 RepID=UPI0025D1C136|nr:aldo/keto reductase [uncultured Methanobrevibacter sp.]
MVKKYELSNFGLGTVQFGLDYGFTKRKTQEEVNDILNVAVENDINLIDTAREYGDSEEKIGVFNKEFDNDFVIATKLSLIDDLNNLSYSFLKKHIQQSVNDSLSNLNLDNIPILQLHQVDMELYNNSDFWSCIEDIKQDKLIDNFGVSVYDTDDTQFLLDNHGDIIDFIQIPYNIFDRRFDSIFEQIKINNIDVISRSTFLKGIIPSPVDNIPSELNDIIPYKLKLESASENVGVRVDELATLFVYYNKNISSTIFGVNSPEELKNNIDTIKQFNEDILDEIDFNELSVSEVKLIDPRQWNEF